MYMHFTLNAIDSLSKIITHPISEPFYASDYGLTSGDINSLKDNGLIMPTGETRESFVRLYDDIYKRVTVKEWIIRDKEFNWKFLEEDLNKLTELVLKFTK